jgi:DNA-binding CsgD family transcriptional regulator
LAAERLHTQRIGLKTTVSPTAAIDLSEAERETLGRWARRPKGTHVFALRRRIVITAAEGKTNGEIATQLGSNRTTVGRVAPPLPRAPAGRLQDEPRPGKPRTITDVDVDRVVRTRAK